METWLIGASSLFASILYVRRYKNDLHSFAKKGIKSRLSFTSKKKMELEKYEPLFDNVMKGRWNQVFAAYKDREIQMAKISKSNDTVLHIAVLKGEKKHVVELVSMIRDEDAEKVLSAQNESKNTPLHLAAALGNEEMCRLMAEKCPMVISIKNADGETPLFVSVLFQNTNVFDRLLEVYCTRIGDAYRLCIKGDNGDTILHAAIKQEYFSLAYKIIKKYPKMANTYNMDDQTPLHALANKPHAFESGSPLAFFDWIIYNCAIVSESEKETTDRKEPSKIARSYPPNYDTFMSICEWIISYFQALLQKGRKGHIDEESQQQNNKTSDRRGSGSSPSGGQGEPHSSAAESESNDPRNLKPENASNEEANYGKKKQFCPPNYETIFHLLRSTIRLLLVILGLGIWRIKKIKETKEKHNSATLLMRELIDKDNYYKKEGDGIEPPRNKPSAFLVAAKMGVAEIVAAILEKHPVAIRDQDSDGKNVVLFAVEYRQIDVFNYLLKDENILKERVFRKLDNEGNSALHLAAKYGGHQPWLNIPGDALQMQWEMKWFKFVKGSMPPHFFVEKNKEGKTPKQILTETHKDLVQKGGEWLTKTSESCSVVSALIAGVAFATAAAVPGGVDPQGAPNLKDKPLFHVFAFLSLVALCSSVTSVVLFLTILTSRFQEKDFEINLPAKLLVGLTTLFLSISAILISFCAGHFFLVEKSLEHAVYPIYVATLLPVTYFGLSQLHLYIDLLWCIFTKMPQPSYTV